MLLFAEIELINNSTCRRVEDEELVATEHGQPLAGGPERKLVDGLRRNLGDKLMWQAVGGIPDTQRLIGGCTRGECAVGTDDNLSYLGTVAEEREFGSPLFQAFTTDIGWHQVHIADRICEYQAARVRRRRDSRIAGRYPDYSGRLYAGQLANDRLRGARARTVLPSPARL